eukprot:jgi/Psemu1/31055/gm1.31055_g
MTIELEQALQKRLDESHGKKEAQLVSGPEQALELERTTNSMPIAEERNILKQIRGVTKTKQQVEEYNEMDAEIKSMKISEALEKVKLANKLECTTDELANREITCPKAKIGMVIGKNGSMVKQIQNNCKVAIELDKGTEKMTITGTEVSIERAVQEIQRIIEIEEEEIDAEQEVLIFLTSKYVDVLQELREEYRNTSIEVYRAGGKVRLRGIPKDIAGIKEKILDLGIVSREREFEGREEINILIGDNGATIDGLCQKYTISIDVGKAVGGKTPVVFIGKPDMIEAALNQVETLIEENKEVVEIIHISIVIKDILLAEGGRHINAMREEIVQAIPNGRCFLNVKDKHRTTNDKPELVVKAKQSMLTGALTFARDALKKLDSLVVKLKVDPYAIPRIIGKGGETINRLKEGKPVTVEVDRTHSEVWYGATSVEALDELRKEIDQVIDSNCVVRIQADTDYLKRQFQSVKVAVSKSGLDGYWLDMDEHNSCYVIRGEKQGIDKATEIVEKHISDNQFGEIPITDEDLNALLSGGKKSKIVQFSEEMSVNLHVDREAFILIVRGPQDKVNEASKRLNQYLNGDDEFSVEKLSVNQQLVGKLIGKGGKTLQQLEEKYEGVSINISKSHLVTIRGPSQAVSDCKVAIAKNIASARVTQSIKVTEEQFATLSKREYDKKIYREMPVQLTTAGDTIIVRGTFCDVRDAVSLLNEMLIGEYRTSIELDASQFARVRNASGDLSHFKRMEAICKAKVELDLKAGSIVLCGKRSNVKRAKDQVYGFLNFLLEHELEQLKISKPLFMTVGQASVLAEISAEAGGVSIHLDRDMSCIVVRSTDRENLKKATDLMNKKIKEAEKLVRVIDFTASDSWIVSFIIGTKGSKISAFRSRYPTCKFSISKETRTISMVGDSEETLKEVLDDINSEIETARKQNVFISIPDGHVAHFLGKAGSHVKEFTAQYEVKIQPAKGDYNFKITGEESKVERAKEAIDAWLVLREKATAALTFTLEREQDIAAILEQKGSVVRSLEEEYKCKIDIDKKTLIVTVRGQEEAKREAVVEKMKELIEKYREEATARHALAKQQNHNAEVDATTEDSTTTKIVANGSHSLPEEHNSEVDARRTEVEENSKKAPYPTQPVGVASKPSKNSKKMKVGATVNGGTEAGQNLLAMLLNE